MLFYCFSGNGSQRFYGILSGQESHKALCHLWSAELILSYTWGRQTGSCSDLTHRYPSLAGLLQGCQSPETVQLPHGQPRRDMMPLEPSFQFMLSVLRCVSLSALTSHPQGPVLEKAWGIWVTFAELEGVMRIFRQRGTEVHAFLSYNLHTWSGKGNDWEPRHSEHVSDCPQRTHTHTHTHTGTLFSPVFSSKPSLGVMLSLCWLF